MVASSCAMKSRQWDPSPLLGHHGLQNIGEAIAVWVTRKSDWDRAERVRRTCDTKGAIEVCSGCSSPSIQVVKIFDCHPWEVSPLPH